MSHYHSYQTLKNITCPACGLLCDDIALSSLTDNSLRCHLAKQFFARASSEQTAMIKGKKVSLADAIASACDILREAKRPLFAGLSTDVHGFRAVQHLAKLTQGTMTHLSTQTSAPSYKVLQSFGWQTTTLTEIRNRADVIVLIGTDARHTPRFFERIVWVEEAMFTQASERQIIYLGGENIDAQVGISPHGKLPQTLLCKTNALPEVLAVLCALVNNKPVRIEQVAGLSVRDLQALADKLKSARYAVLVWHNKELDFPHAEFAIQSITSMVTTLNQTTRAGAFSLGGSDGDTSVVYAHTWLNGDIPSVAELDNHDALIWINSFSPHIFPPAGNMPMLVLGASDSVFEQAPEVFIPIATPGLETHGTLFRCDGSVALPIVATRPATLLSLAEVLAQIAGMLQFSKT